MREQPKEFRETVAGRELVVTVGELAGQADAGVTVRLGDTVVLGTCVMGPPRPGIGFMPLLVDYEEKFYAAGKIKGSRFVKREGKPTDRAITTGRLIDRSIRPLFPKNLQNDIQVVATVLSYDDANEPDTVALLAVSAALSVSKIPWNGPLGVVRVGRRQGQFVVNPVGTELADSDLDLLVAATATDAVMIEAGAQEMSEENLREAIAVGTAAAGDLARFIQKIAAAVGVPKVPGEYFSLPEDLVAAVRPVALPRIEAALADGSSKLSLNDRVDAVAAELSRQFGNTPERAAAVQTICRDLHQEVVREWILSAEKRVGGRKLSEVRPLRVAVGVLPRTHGSALFERGETQILSVTTLGAPDDALILDTMTEEDVKKRFFHLYNMPAFSVGEIRPNRGPGRREIGHGALAERAVSPLVPAKEIFPYTVMVVSEVLSSNGSSSMGSACGASLALMDAGVPVPRHVAGIAMGLVTDQAGRGRPWKVLTDIAGMEDEGCDMDFKVAGTRAGVTALQVDIKISGLSPDIVAAALAGAKVARAEILEAMERVLPAPRPELSPYAPRIVAFTIPVEKIRDVIGPRGTTINKIIEETGVEISVEDDGQVSITGTDAAALQRATEWVRSLVREAAAGEEYDGRVTRLMNFGAFVELFPGTEGLVHISEFAAGFVRNIEDVVKVGDVLPVVVREIDSLGRVNLQLKNRPAGAGTPRPTSSDRLPRRSFGQRRGGPHGRRSR